LLPRPCPAFVTLQAYEVWNGFFQSLVFVAFLLLDLFPGEIKRTLMPVQVVLSFARSLIAPVLTTTLLSMLLLMTLASARAGIKRGTARR
jgi:hypothetical protein